MVVALMLIQHKNIRQATDDTTTYIMMNYSGKPCKHSIHTLTICEYTISWGADGECVTSSLNIYSNVCTGNPKANYVH